MSLTNYRNYESLDLKLPPGTNIVHGANGQGKSNLLEALYLLAVAKSPRASSERDLVRQPVQEGTHGQVAATAVRDTDQVRVQIDFVTTPAAMVSDRAGGASNLQGASVRKQVRVNGLARRHSELLGEINAVMFTAQDLELVYGAPAVRRRYLNILISQLDRRYLLSLRRYESVLHQRNQLLKMVREGRSQVQELDFWTDELIAEAGYLLTQRAEVVRALSGLAEPLYRGLTHGGGERTEIIYRPGLTPAAEWSEKAVSEALRQELELQSRREIAQGFTISGPHRDDLELLMNGMDAGQYASRGQARTLALAMKLAEASYLEEHRRQQPILLLDDVLSELDGARRARVLERATGYQQAFISTTDLPSIEGKHISEAHLLAVDRGRAEAAAAFGGG